MGKKGKLFPDLKFKYNIALIAHTLKMPQTSFNDPGSAHFHVISFPTTEPFYYTEHLSQP